MRAHRNLKLFDLSDWCRSRTIRSEMDWESARKLIFAAYVFGFVAIMLSFYLKSPASKEEDREPGSSGLSTKPNIILISGDDLGWNDVSFHGYSEIATPNIDRLAHEGVILNSFYAQYLCTPSRAALMTGKYPIRNGLQYKIIKNTEPRGLPVTEKILPQYLKELGYSTHLVGKWNLGYYQKRMLPTNRGFDTFFGYHGTSIHYYNYTFTPKDRSHCGFDLWNGTQPAHEYVGQYATNAFNNAAVRLIESQDSATPMFLYLSHVAPHTASGLDDLPVPQEYADRFPHIAHAGRRKYAGMVSALDDSVGSIVQALERKGMLNNTVIVFFSDNGGGAEEQIMFPLNKPSFGSNWPLRGAKNTQFEGGVRVVALVWSPLLQNPGRVSTELYHISDLLPTFANLAGATLNSSSGLDGLDVWKSISEDLPSPRKELLIQADVRNNEYALRWNQYKLVLGLHVDKEGRKADDWYEPPGGLNRTLITDMQAAIRCGDSASPCDPNAAPCLFDVVADPCEQYDVAAEQSDILELMLVKLRVYNSTALPSMFLPIDPRGHPDLHGGLMASWEE